jgi:hypothetical protein
MPFNDRGRSDVRHTSARSRVPRLPYRRRAPNQSFVLSVSLWFAGNRDEGVFVGLWVPSILALGAFVLSTLDSPGGRS